LWLHTQPEPAVTSVAVVVPLSTRASLTADEEISLRHLEHFLGKYDKYLVAPEGRSFARPGFETTFFPRKYFGSASAHGRLQFSEGFYARFEAYKYILMYHLDSLVLSDQLAKWCETGLDLIGPPWLPSDDSPWVKRPQVGNGGFALMKIESFLNVIRSERRGVDPDEFWREFCAANPPHRQWMHLPRKYLKRLRMFNNVRWEMRGWCARTDGTGNVDYFWANEAIKYWPQFRIASVEQGLEFAFEVAPRMCFEMNHHRLPFGSHAWARYDRGFWEPYLLQ
jgi:uncharacterized protein DUF5672